MSISNRLDEIQARADKATDGPWITGGSIEEGVTRFGTLNDPDDPSEPGVLLGDVAYEANAEFIADARTDVPALVAALRAVLDLHKPYPDEGMGWRDDNTYGYVGTVCGSCGTPDEYGVPWPCLTVRAITAALGEES